MPSFLQDVLLLILNPFSLRYRQVQLQAVAVPAVVDPAAVAGPAVVVLAVVVLAVVVPAARPLLLPPHSFLSHLQNSD